jgi:hypothetical protein
MTRSPPLPLPKPNHSTAGMLSARPQTPPTCHCMGKSATAPASPHDMRPRTARTRCKPAQPPQPPASYRKPKYYINASSQRVLASPTHPRHVQQPLPHHAGPQHCCFLPVPAGEVRAALGWQLPLRPLTAGSSWPLVMPSSRGRGRPRSHPTRTRPRGSSPGISSGRWRARRSRLGNHSCPPWLTSSSMMTSSELALLRVPRGPLKSMSSGGQ